MQWCGGGVGGRCGGGGVEPYLGACYLREVRATTAWRWPSEWRCGTCGRALQPGGSFVRSLGRSGLCSEVRPCLSCCTERAHEMTSSPAIWKQRRLPVPPAAPMDHAPWCGGRVAPSPGTRAAIVAFGVSCEADLGQNGPCGILLKTKPSQKKQAGPADAISYRVRREQNTATQRTFPITAIPFYVRWGGPYTFGHGP